MAARQRTQHEVTALVMADTDVAALDARTQLAAPANTDQTGVTEIQRVHQAAVGPVVATGQGRCGLRSQRCAHRLQRRQSLAGRGFIAGCAGRSQCLHRLLGISRFPGELSHAGTEAAVRYLPAQLQQLLAAHSRHDHRRGGCRHRHHCFGHGCGHRCLDQLLLHRRGGLQGCGTGRGSLLEAAVVAGGRELNAGQGGVERSLLHGRISVDRRFGLIVPTISQLQAHARHAFLAGRFKNGKRGDGAIVQARRRIGQAAASGRCGCRSALCRRLQGVDRAIHFDGAATIAHLQRAGQAVFQAHQLQLSVDLLEGDRRRRAAEMLLLAAIG
ncbi:hypothetical protein D3C72_974540 [compost metagenome]